MVQDFGTHLQYHLQLRSILQGLTCATSPGLRQWIQEQIFCFDWISCCHGPKMMMMRMIILVSLIAMVSLHYLDFDTRLETCFSIGTSLVQQCDPAKIPTRRAAARWGSEKTCCHYSEMAASSFLGFTNNSPLKAMAVGRIMDTFGVQRIFRTLFDCQDLIVPWPTPAGEVWTETPSPHLRKTLKNQRWTGELPMQEDLESKLVAIPIGEGQAV